MKVVIFGAGAIGGYIAVHLHRAGIETSIVARGAHLSAMRENGLTLKSNGETVTARLPVTDRADDFGTQDCVIVTIKANALPAAAPEIAKLIGPRTILVSGTNGIPYWYFYRLDGPWRNRTLRSVDPDGQLLNLLPPQQTVGCVIFHAAEVVEPGVIEHTYANRFSLGEPGANECARADLISGLLTKAGLKAPVCANIRNEVWTKLWGNLAFSPLSVLTGLTVDRLAFQPDLRAVARAMMQEAAAVADALGVAFTMDVEQRIDLTGSVGAHSTSMLQDLKRSRPMEIDAVLGAVVELGQLTGQPLPLCEAVLSLVRGRAQQAGLYPGQAFS